MLFHHHNHHHLDFSPIVLDLSRLTVPDDCRTGTCSKCKHRIESQLKEWVRKHDCYTVIKITSDFRLEINVCRTCRGRVEMKTSPELTGLHFLSSPPAPPVPPYTLFVLRRVQKGARKSSPHSLFLAVMFQIFRWPIDPFNCRCKRIFPLHEVQRHSPDRTPLGNVLNTNFCLAENGFLISLQFFKQWCRN